MFEKVLVKEPVMWECKECHHQITNSETVAYQLIQGVLYGWCEPCFVASRGNSTQKFEIRVATNAN
jgi:hypothetical protein